MRATTKFALALTAAIGLSVATPVPSFAQHHGGGGGWHGGGGGGWHGGNGGWHGGGWHGGGWGGWHHDRFFYGGGFVGWPYWGWGWPYYAGAPYWDYPYVGGSVVYQQAAPSVAAPAAPAPAPSWYYCDNPAGYYPYVANCNNAWRPVPATPPQQ